MTWFVPMVMRLFWWMLPRLLSEIVDRIGDVIQVVDSANSLGSEAARRDYVLRNLGMWGINVPDWLCRILLEAGVVLNKLGIRAEHLDRMESLLAGKSFELLICDETARNSIIAQFKGLFPDLPEHAGRLLFELAMAKLRGK